MEMQSCFYASESVSVIQHTNRLKDRNHMILSIDAEKTFDKVQHPSTIKASRKLGMKGTFLHIV